MVLKAGPLHDALERALGQVPLLVRAQVILFSLRIANAQIDLVVVKSERIEHEAGEVEDPLELALDLIGRAEEMRVILREPPDAREPVKHAGLLEPVDRAELRDPDRQLAVRAFLPLVDEDVERAVHRLEHVLLLVDLQEVHVLAVEVSVPRLLPEVDLGDMRRVDDRVAALQVLRFPEVLDHAPHGGAVRVPEISPPPASSWTL